MDGFKVFAWIRFNLDKIENLKTTNAISFLLISRSLEREISPVEVADILKLKR